jgi:hypothetical protein
VHPILLIQELQAIELKHHNNYISQVEFMSYYAMIATNKRYSYLRVTMIRIDVHHIVENPINMPHAFHARFAYGPGSYISRGQHRQPFASSHKDEIDPYTRKKSWWAKTD